MSCSSFKRACKTFETEFQIASRDVTKIVGRIDTNSMTSVLKSCSAQNYKPANFFDIR